MFLELLDTKCSKCSGSVMWEETFDGKAMRCTLCNYSQLPAQVNPDVGIPKGFLRLPFNRATWRAYRRDVLKLNEYIKNRKSNKKYPRWLQIPKLGGD